MDQARPKAPGSTRWLAGVVALLVLAGAVSAGVLIADDDGPAAVVSAAGGQSGTVDVTSTVTVPLPVQPSTPPSTVATTTTLPRAAEDVLNAIGGSTTTTRRQATTTTTRPPATTTTLPAPPTTSTTAPPAPFIATLVNEHPLAVVVKVNGRDLPLSPAQTLDVELPISQRGDLVQVRLAGDDKCGVSDSGLIFKPGGTYRVVVVQSDTMCKDSAARIPLLRIGPK